MEAKFFLKHKTHIADRHIGEGKLLKTINRIQTLIDRIECTEKNTFFTGEQYDAGVTELIKLLQYKAQSVNGQS